MQSILLVACCCSRGRLVPTETEEHQIYGALLTERTVLVRCLVVELALEMSIKHFLGHQLIAILTFWVKLSHGQGNKPFADHTFYCLRYWCQVSGSWLKSIRTRYWLRSKYSNPWTALVSTKRVCYQLGYPVQLKEAITVSVWNMSKVGRWVLSKSKLCEAFSFLFIEIHFKGRRGRGGLHQI